MKRFLSIIIAITALAAPVTEAFVPLVKNWAQTQYEAANQNWALAQDAEGRIYVANHKGLLEYDGCKWTLHKTARPDIVRSVYVDANDRIYVGAQNDFGYFERDAFGQMNYTSLMQRLETEAGKNDTQVWSIVETGGTVYFQTYWGYYSFDGETVSCTEVHFQLSRLTTAADGIYYFHRNKIARFTPGNMSRPSVEKHKGQIKCLVPFFDETGIMLAVTEKDGLIKFDGTEYTPWHTDADALLNSAGMNRAVITADSVLVIGTVMDGVFAFDAGGHLLWHLNMDNSLQNNTVLDIFCDRDNNIWLALDYGVSMISGDRSVSIKTLDRNIGSVFDAEQYGGCIYVASNQGLFRIPDTPVGNDVELVPGMSGFVLSLYRTEDNMMIAGHSTKTVLVSPDGKTRILSEKGGGMCTKPFKASGRDYLMVSSYTAMSIYGKDDGGEWNYLYSMKGFDNPVRCFETDADGRLWAGHSRKGLYCIETDKERTQATSVQFFNSPSSGQNARTGVFKVKDRLVFTDNEKCYVYDGIRNEIVPYDLLNDSIGDFAKAHDIVGVNDETYWFITDEAAALVRLSGTHRPEILKTIVYKDYGFIMLDGRENIVPVDDGHSLLCVHNAIAMIAHDSTTESGEGHIFITGITATDEDGDAVFLELGNEKPARIAYRYNNLSFNIANPVFCRKTASKYRLTGLNSEWLDIPDNGTIVFNRLPSGKYTFELGDGNGSTVAVKAFSIKPPFYLSAWAWGIYALLLAAVIALAIYLTRLANEDALQKLRTKNEQEIIRMENERLKNDIAYKGKQLSSSSMALIRRTEMLQELLNELDRQKDILGTQYPNKYYNKMRSLIENNLSSDEEWKIFQTNFDLIHEGFFRILSERYPELSQSDLKLCALLRLNMDTKEIAQMTNITVRGVETRRYRLRQKLGLHPEDSLSKFLIDIK